MRFEPSFVAELRDDMSRVVPDLRKRVERPGGLSEQALLDLVARPPSSDVTDYEPASVADTVRPTPDDVLLGEEAIARGEVAFVVLAGGSGTRTGEPKAFLRLPKVGITLATHKLQQASCLAYDGSVLRAPAWFMVSPQDAQRFVFHMSVLCPPPDGCAFTQFESYRLKPNYRIDFTDRGIADLHPTGHGDVGPALVESAVLRDNPKVKHCVIVNVDNVLASIDPATVGLHLRSGRHVTCEVFQARSDEPTMGSPGGLSSGGLVWVDGRLQVVDGFRLPPNALSAVPLRNTNTMIVSRTALEADVAWSWHRVRRVVAGRVVVQHERLLQQYTAENETTFVLVDRDQRYLSIKTVTDVMDADVRLNGNVPRR